jgi:hypothetical protein
VKNKSYRNLNAEIIICLHPLRSIPLLHQCNNSNAIYRSEALLEVISRQGLHRVLRFGMDLFNAFKQSPLELEFHLWEKEKNHRLRGLVRRDGRGWLSCSQNPKSAQNERRLIRSLVMVQGPGGVAPLVRTFAPDVSLSRIITSQQNFPFTICPAGKNFLYNVKCQKTNQYLFDIAPNLSCFLR